VLLKNIIEKIPVPTAGMALGLISLGVLLKPYSEAFHIIFVVLSLLMVLTLCLKMVMFPHSVREDLKNPILASVLGTFFMTFMQLATYLVPLPYSLALFIWGAAVLGHCCLIVYFTVAFIFKLNLKQVYPSYFIVYAGIVLATISSPLFGLELLGSVIFWFGAVCIVVMIVLVACRYVRFAVPEPAKPLLCIFAVPISLFLVAYLAISPEPQPAVVITMIICAQLSLLLVLTQLPKLLRLPFYPSYAAMTFPFVMCASALTKATASLQTFGINSILLIALEGLVLIETVFAAAMVLYVFARYLLFFFSAGKAGQAGQAG